MNVGGSSPMAARRAGWWATLLLAPHLLLGTWLRMVPDHLAFWTSQVVTLLHVALALVTVPIVALWIVLHARRLPAKGTQTRPGNRAIRWGLTLATLAAAVTGFFVLRGGDIAPANALHTWCGLAIAVPLAAHLWSGRRRAASLGVLALLVLATGGASIARRVLPPEPLEPVTGDFAFVTKPSALYESAAACGECHTEQYEEWRSSTHARAAVHPIFRERLQREPDAAGFDLASFGTLQRGGTVAHADKAVGTCEKCHMPTSFYGDDPHGPLDPAPGPGAEGITCSFCHTLRAVAPGIERGKPLGDIQQDDFPRVMPRLPFFVSSPESVRRYLGQGSENRVAHWIANELIRWRPTVHRHDQHAQVLDTSLACMPCHSHGSFDARPDIPLKAYAAWEQSRFNTGDPTTTVTCQGCHLARDLTGANHPSPGPYVHWGPTRGDHVSHRLLGGNAQVAAVMKDPDQEQREHALNLRVATVEIVGARTSEVGLDVDVRVTPHLVGHFLPSVAAQNRYLWVEVSGLAADGTRLATTPTPSKGDDVGGDTPIMFRCIEPARADCDTVLRPDTPRVFTAHLHLPPGASPTSLFAELHSSVDSLPLGDATAPSTVPPGHDATAAISRPDAGAGESNGVDGGALPQDAAPTDDNQNAACSFSTETARAVFDALIARKKDEDCAFLGTRADHAQLFVRWAKDDVELTPIEIAPAHCSGGLAKLGRDLAVTAPPSVATACPASVKTTRAVAYGP